MFIRMNNWCFLFLFFVFPLFTVQGVVEANVKTPFSGGTYRAVVIGNDIYRDPEGIWRKLKTARNDARAVASLLEKTYGFTDVSLVLDATRSDIFQAFRRLEREAKTEDAILIYYAGHGYFKRDTDEAFWIPVDAKGTDDSTFISNETIRKKIEVLAKRTQHTLVISDSCFSGSLLRPGNRGIRIQERTPRYFEKVASRKSVQLLAAGGLEYVDDDYRGSGHSPFTYHFIKELERNSELYLTATELSTKVEKLVADNVPQKPEKGVLYQAGHEGGEFIFTREVALLTQPKPKAEKIPDAGVSQDVMIELTYWNSIKDSSDVSLFTHYLKRYPHGQFVDIAKHKIEQLSQQEETVVLSDLISNAKNSFERGEYEVARDIWGQVRTIQPDNQSAKEGLENIVIVFLEKATKARKGKKFSEAEIFIKKAEELGVLTSKVEKAKKSLDREIKSKGREKSTTKVPPPSF